MEQTIEGFLATQGVAAAIVTSTLAFIAAIVNIALSAYLGRKAGSRAVAAFRQQWIDTLRKTLAEYHSILMSVERPLSVADDRALSNLGTQIELMLNSDEEASQKLEQIMDQIYNAHSLHERVVLDPAFIAAARRVLKDEWKRVKSELK
ncbi:hypothetical protein [Bradyrhizobium sp. HKCCYLS3013]|uniref:hypothetical protein n=1 Tax=Bradyrhizobium sp. HKCCYLS3013 TaxID=3420735 RepID=UPI003EBAB3F5